LLGLGITHIMRETYAGSLEMTADVLQELGLSFAQSKSTVERFREHDEEILRSSYQHQGDLKKLAQMADQARKELEQLFDKDEQEKPV
jgi:glutathione-regulated potassium-efflux system protein KefB